MLRLSGHGRGVRAVGFRWQQAHCGGAEGAYSGSCMWSYLSWIMSRHTLGNVLHRSVASTRQRTVTAVHFLQASGWASGVLSLAVTSDRPGTASAQGVRGSAPGKLRQASGCRRKWRTRSVGRWPSGSSSFSTSLPVCVGCAGVPGRPRAARQGVLLRHCGVLLRWGGVRLGGAERLRLAG